ncbi:membrane protein insertion efficiency factor YidD [Candidatus Peregrinibacteria bacterium RIFOXYB2_FULL_32_7]|nr:MAG: membrane protein insertion efficiency factor YidD [Candidatus Peregrinibacteria bacterium RIFOXYB2_FULL_32_7]
MIQKLLLQFIALYQKLLSPDHSSTWKWLFPHGYCKFQPSCSEYAKMAIKKHGIIKGIVKSIWRILKCNPWSKGGLDLP